MSPGARSAALRRQRPNLRLAGAVFVGMALVALVGLPLARLAVEAVVEGVGRVIGAIGSAGADAIANSLWTSAAVTVLAVGGGLALALLTERTDARSRRWLRVAILSPLAIPGFVSAISWAAAYGPGGLAARLTGIGLPGLFGPLGIVLVLTVEALPLGYLVIVAGMRVRAEPDLERAARASGAGPLTTFVTIGLPILAPILLAAAGLVFVTTLNAFGVPAVLGTPAGFVTITTRIYQDLAFSASDAAFARVIGLAGLLVLLAAGLVAFADRASPRALRRPGGPAGAPGALARPPRGAAIAAWLVVVVGVALPLAALVLTALTRAVGLLPAPGNLTLANFAAAMDGHAVRALGNSLLLASATAVGAVTLAFVGAAVSSRRSRTRLGSAVTLGFAVPGSVLAVAVLLAYGPGLRDTLAIILLAYLAKLWALAQRPIASAFDRVPDELLSTARVHGATAGAMVRTVLAPLLAPVLGAAALLVFIFALHEVTISILLYGPTTATLAVVVMNLEQVGDPTVTSALAVLLTLLIATVGAAFLAVRRRWRAQVDWP
jgi:iron(III) transport system permease protein